MSWNGSAGRKRPLSSYGHFSRPAVRAALIVVAVGSLVAACGDSGSDGDPSVTVDGAKSSLDLIGADELEQQRKTLIVSPEGVRTGAILGIRLPSSEKDAAVLTAWQGYWKVRVSAGLTASLNAKALQAVAAGDAITEIQTEVRQLKAKDGHRAGTMILKPRNLKYFGEQVAFIDCVLDETYTILEDDSGTVGEARNNGMSVMMKKLDGEWRVMELKKSSSFCVQ
ncbi:MAG: hypothetical protein QG608_282 [Actinomycetota bacterium]|nr:hypothetical protein [Actinomycetota bacterium]